MKEVIIAIAERDDKNNMTIEMSWNMRFYGNWDENRKNEETIRRIESKLSDYKAECD